MTGVTMRKRLPTISDREYDRLYKELIDLEAKFPQLVTPIHPPSVSEENRYKPLPKFSIAFRCLVSTTLIPKTRSPIFTNESRNFCPTKRFPS